MMKVIYTILLFTSYKANATNYYFATAGNDGNPGTINSPWQTIAKFNSFFSSTSPGDSILFNRGDSWAGTLTVSRSGSSGSPIVIGSYGTGLKPIITGLQTLGGFTNVGNVWSSTATNSVTQLNTVLIGGQIMAKARYPNTTFLQTNAPSTTTTINTALTGTPSYVGSEIAFHSQSWIWDISKVTAQSTGALTVSPAVSNSSSGNNQFFFQNMTSFLDVAGEWVYDSTTKLLSVYATSSPSVQISTIDTLCWFANKSYITFDGLNFIGANKIALGYDTSHYIIVQNCSFNNNGKIALQHSGSRNNTFAKDSFVNTLSVAIWTFYRCPQTLIDSCYLRNSGQLVGMAASGNLTSMGMFNAGDSCTTTNNRVDSSGYIGIFWTGKKSLVYHNFVSNYGGNKSDVGGIYTNGGDTNSIVRSNIVINGNQINYISPGIYIDDNTAFVTVDSNTVYNAYQYGVLVHNSNNITFSDNTVIDSIGTIFSIQGGSPGNNSPITRNIFYTKSTSQYILNSGFSATIISRLDSNYYLYPASATNIIYNPSNNTYYTLATWRTASGFDLHTRTMPTGITSAPALFYYNASVVDLVQSLNGTYIDAKGVSYTNTITIQPYQSAILFYSQAQPKFHIGNLIFN